MKKAATTCYAFLGVLGVLVGSRIAYTEIARKEMNDYKTKVAEVLADKELRNQYDAQHWAVTAKESKLAQAKDPGNECNRRSLDPIGNMLNGTTCAQVDPVAIQEAEEAWRMMKEDEFIRTHGTYENWAIKQSGINKTHRWLSYPQELKERLEKGEREDYCLENSGSTFFETILSICKFP